MTVVRRLLDYSAVADVMEGAEAARIAAGKAASELNEAISTLSVHAATVEAAVQESEQVAGEMSAAIDALGASGIFVMGAQDDAIYLHSALYTDITETEVEIEPGLLIPVAQVGLPTSVLGGPADISALSPIIRRHTLNFFSPGDRTLLLPEAGQIKAIHSTHPVTYVIYASREDMEADRGRLILASDASPTVPIILEGRNHPQDTTRSYFVPVDGAQAAYVYATGPTVLTITVEEVQGV